MREAEVSVTDRGLAAMGVEELLSLTRSAGLLAVEELTCRGNGAVLQVEVETKIDEDGLSTLDCVARPLSGVSSLRMSSASMRTSAVEV